MNSLILRLCSRCRFYGTVSGSSSKSTVGGKQIPSQTATSVPKSSTGVSPNPLKDVVIFRYENVKQFKYLDFFAITQFGFWMFISYTGLHLVNVPVETTPKKANSTEVERTDVGSSEDMKSINSKNSGIAENSDNLPFYRKINLGEDKYKYGLCAATFIMGYGILFGSWFYIVRSVRYLVLRKDRKTVSFVTYGPFGRNRIMDVPLDHVSATGSRNSGGVQMGVKVKNKYLFYIVDLKGEFPQPRLFDQTVGMRRTL